MLTKVRLCIWYMEVSICYWQAKDTILIQASVFLLFFFFVIPFFQKEVGMYQNYCFHLVGLLRKRQTHNKQSKRWLTVGEYRETVCTQCWWKAQLEGQHVCPGLTQLGSFVWFEQYVVWKKELVCGEIPNTAPTTPTPRMSGPLKGTTGASRLWWRPTTIEHTSWKRM